MEEGGVAEDGTDLSDGLPCQRLPAPYAPPIRTHTDTGVEGLERWCGCQRIATDVTEDKAPSFFSA